METELYRSAFAAQSWHRASVRSLLAALIDEHPAATEQDLINKFASRAREDEEYLLAAIEYAVVQNLQTLQRRKIVDPVERKTQRADLKKAADLVVENIKEQILLLNQEMPNGKRLRFCSGAEVAKFGAGYSKIAKKVGPTKLVGAVLSEPEVRGYLGR